MGREGDGSLRDAMPEIAAWIDGLREVFGAAAIDGQIRRGLRGQSHFYAQENGHVLGVPLSPPGVALEAMVITKGEEGSDAARKSRT